jgi:hypothetical protein
VVLRKLGYNDMLGKGWDSAPQESYCWQKFKEGGDSTDPNSNQFWWVPKVFEMHGHAWNWDAHKRRPDGRFLKFPPSETKSKTDSKKPEKEASTVVRLLRLASLLPMSQADSAQALIGLAEVLCDGTLKIEE